MRLSARALAALGGGALSGLLGAALALWPPGVLSNVEAKTYDARVKAFARPEDAASDIVIVAVDEGSINAMERAYQVGWPWPHSFYAPVVRWLGSAGVKAVAFDFLFLDQLTSMAADYEAFGDAMAEAANVCIGVGAEKGQAARSVAPAPKVALRLATGSEAGARMLQRQLLYRTGGRLRTGSKSKVGAGPAGYLEARREVLAFFDSESDARAEALRMAKNDSLAELLDARQLASPAIGPAAGAEPFFEPAGRYRHHLWSLENRWPAQRLPMRSRARLPIAGYLLDSHLGNVFNDPGEDGVFREIELVAVGGAEGLVPSLALAAAAEGSRPGCALDFRDLRCGRFSAPLGTEGRALLRFYGGRGTYRTIAYVDVFESATAEEGAAPRIDPATLRGKYVFVGPTALALGDLRATPLDAHQPGVEVNAAALDNLLHSGFLRRAREASAAAWCLVLALAGAAVVAAAGSRRARRGGLITAGALVGVVALAVGAAFAAYARGVWLDLIAPLFAGVLGVSSAAAANFVSERRQKGLVTDALGKYVSPEIVESVLRDPSSLALGGERRVMTVYFSDIRGFTTLSEGQSPERIVGFLNDYLTELTDVVIRNHGYVDKYIGDAIMAFWGAPVRLLDHAVQACRAALAMARWLRELHPRFMERYGLDVAARAGVNSGPMVVGNLGSRQKLNYTVIGDAVNLASRLEGANKSYTTEILIGEETFALAKEAIVARELDLLRVKGKAQAVKIYELCALAGQLPPERERLHALFAEGLAAYRGSRFDQARRAFEAALALAPHDGPAMVYKERSAAYQAAPPPEGWDGVFEMHEK